MGRWWISSRRHTRISLKTCPLINSKRSKVDVGASKCADIAPPPMLDRVPNIDAGKQLTLIGIAEVLFIIHCMGFPDKSRWKDRLCGRQP